MSSDRDMDAPKGQEQTEVVDSSVVRNDVDDPRRASYQKEEKILFFSPTALVSFVERIEWDSQWGRRSWKNRTRKNYYQPSIDPRLATLHR